MKIVKHNFVSLLICFNNFNKTDSGKNEETLA